MSNIDIGKALYMAETKNSIVDYLTEQLSINSNSLKQYEVDNLLPNNTPAEIMRMREVEAIKLRDRIHELTSHIAAIKRIIHFDDGQNNNDPNEKQKPPAAKPANPKSIKTRVKK